MWFQVVVATKLTVSAMIINVDICRWPGADHLEPEPALSVYIFIADSQLCGHNHTSSTNPAHCAQVRAIYPKVIARPFLPVIGLDTRLSLISLPPPLSLSLTPPPPPPPLSLSLSLSLPIPDFLQLPHVTVSAFRTVLSSIKLLLVGVMWNLTLWRATNATMALH